jgi:hypothetical protein
LNSIELFDCLLGECHEPPQKFIGPLDHPCGVIVEGFGYFNKVPGARCNHLGNLLHSFGDALKIGVAPFIKFVEVEYGPGPVLGPSTVTLWTASIVLGGARSEDVIHPGRELSARSICILGRANEGTIFNGVRTDSRNERLVRAV